MSYSMGLAGTPHRRNSFPFSFSRYLFPDPCLNILDGSANAIDQISSQEEPLNADAKFCFIRAESQKAQNVEERENRIRSGETKFDEVEESDKSEDWKY